GDSGGDPCSGGINAVAKLGDAFRFVDLINAFDASWYEEILAFVGFGTGASLYVLAAMAVTIFFGVIMLLTLIAFAGTLFVRYFMLSFLLVISPAAWLLWIFPKTKKHFTEWWTKFIHWVIFAPLMLLFMYLALRVLQVFNEHEEGIAHY